MPGYDGEGYARWPTTLPTLNTRGVRFKVDGHTVLGSMRLSQEWETGGVSLRMADRTKLYQNVCPRPKQPFSMAPWAGQIEIKFKYQDDAIRFRRAARFELPVLIWTAVWLEDGWFLRNGESGQTEWRAARRCAWDGSTITHATHPPRASIDGVEQEIITVGTPTPGQVKVPTTQTAGAGYFSVTTPANPDGSRLILLYYPEHIVLLRGPVDDWPEVNAWMFTAECEELLAGDYD